MGHISNVKIVKASKMLKDITINNNDININYDFYSSKNNLNN